jgi:hypothetical protein
MSPSARTVGKSIGIGLVVFIAIQLVPVDRTNPPIQTDVPATSEQRAVLKRACYDCHSNETAWRWYGYVAPVSWLIARDVHEGRRELNFSTWNLLATQTRLKKMRESWEQVEKGEMPPWIYMPPHPDAHLSEADRLVLRTWSLSGSRSGGN